MRISIVSPEREINLPNIIRIYGNIWCVCFLVNQHESTPIDSVQNPKVRQPCQIHLQLCTHFSFSKAFNNKLNKLFYFVLDSFSLLIYIYIQFWIHFRTYKLCDGVVTYAIYIFKSFTVFTICLRDKNTQKWKFHRILILHLILWLRYVRTIHILDIW